MSTSTRFTTGKSEGACDDVRSVFLLTGRPRYHDENTKLEDLTHPEDIEHFKKHEQMEEEQERIENMEKESIVLENVPEKFRRQT